MRQLVITMLTVVAVAGFTMASASAELKIGAVDTNKLMSGAPQAKIAFRRIENELADERNEIEEMGEKLNSLKSRLNQGQAAMTDAAQLDILRQIEETTLAIKRQRDEVSRSLNQRTAQLRSELERTMTVSIQRFARSAGYNLILSQGVVYADGMADITNEILAHLQREFDAGNR